MIEAAKLFADPNRRFESTDGTEWKDRRTLDYADRVMGMIGNFDEAAVGDLRTYLDAGTYKQDKPGLHDGYRAKRTKQRAGHVGKELPKGDSTLGDKIDGLVIDKAAAIRNTVLSAEQVLSMYECDMQAMRDTNYWKGATDAYNIALSTHKPTAAMKPDAYKTLLDTAMGAYLDAAAVVWANRWRDNETPTNEACNKRLAAIKKAWKEGASASAITALIEETGAPQIVIADTNWGSGENHTFFLIVGDPTTGKPRLYQRTDPPGDLRHATDKWAAAKWAKVA